MAFTAPGFRSPGAIPRSRARDRGCEAQIALPAIATIVKLHAHNLITGTSMTPPCTRLGMGIIIARNSPDRQVTKSPMPELTKSLVSLRSPMNIHRQRRAFALASVAFVGLVLSTWPLAAQT